MDELINISVPTGAVVALLGYAVVFLGIVMLMIVVMIMSRIMIASRQKKSAPAGNAAAPEQIPFEPIPVAPAPPAPGTAGELKLYDTDPRTAAMIMAIVADKTGRPLNELRFISIREVKEE